MVSPITEMWVSSVSHRSIALYCIVIGVVMMCGPSWIYGSTWSYFQYTQHAGVWMGWAAFINGILIALAIRKCWKRFLAFMLFVGGTGFWLSASLIFIEGAASHHGCMEALFMMFPAVQMLIRSAAVARK